MRCLKVVMAEDEDDVWEYFAELLAHHGHDVVAVTDAPSLVAACREEEPDVVVSDWWLGAADGLEAVAEANRERAVPVVLVTGSDLGGLPELAGRNVAAVLCKPIRPGELKAAVERAAGRE